MKKVNPLITLVIGIGLGLGIYHLFLLPKGTSKFAGIVAGIDLSWLEDTAKANITVGANYLFASRKDVDPIRIKGEVPSAAAAAAVSYLKTYTDTCKSFNLSRSFVISFSKEEVHNYFGNVDRLSLTDSLRVYLGMYPPDHPKHPNKLTAYLVARGVDKKEKYIDGVGGLQIVNLGTLCPTDCPDDETVDPESVYVKAGKPY